MKPPPDPRPDLPSLQGKLRHCFRRPELLEQAVTHSSFAHEAGEGARGDNETLEFLGDAVLSFLTAEMLYRDAPSGAEGEMSRTKAHLVSDANLARLAAELRLGDHLRLGVGEERSGGREKASILSGALEAVLAAVFLDGGTRAARALVHRLLGPRARGAAPRADHKTALQELLQGRGLPRPGYEVVERAGPDHQVRFRVRATLDGRALGEGEGGTKKAAEQRAARAALERLGDGREEA